MGSRGGKRSLLLTIWRRRRSWSRCFSSTSGSLGEPIARTKIPETAVEAQLQFARETLTSEDLVLFSKRRVDLDGQLMMHAFVGKGREKQSQDLLGKALEKARKSDANRRDGKPSISFLDGIPIAVKDNFAMRGEIVSAGSKMLSENECSYTATVIDRLEQSGAVVFGQTTMDEFGMGVTRETVETRR